jgi:heterodisulfide reductase subunit C2
MTELNPALQLPLVGTTWSSALAVQNGIRVASCYQCLRCSNSCPVSTFMDIKPHQVVRLVQLGQQEKLLQCSSIWVCLSCEMCTTYCPNEIDVAGLMNHLKNLVVAGRRLPAEPDIFTFHEVFLSALHKNGRINDLQLMQRYKWKRLMQGNLPPRDEVLRDLWLAIQLLKRKRLRLLPEKSPAAGEIRAIRQQLGSREDAS